MSRNITYSDKLFPVTKYMQSADKEKGKIKRTMPIVLSRAGRALPFAVHVINTKPSCELMHIRLKVKNKALDFCRYRYGKQPRSVRLFHFLFLLEK